MKKQKMKKHVMKHAAKCTAIAALTLTMALQPCFSFTSLADSGGYGEGYSYLDDPSYVLSWFEKNERKVTDVTRSYDDGTKYSARYQYDIKAI